MQKRKAVIALVALALALVFAAAAGAQQAAAPAASAPAAAAAAAAPAPAQGVQWKYLAAAIAVGVACIAGGLAVGQIGAAAMGAMAENPELSGKALPYVGLAEGICLWGFLVALLMLLI